MGLFEAVRSSDVMMVKFGSQSGNFDFLSIFVKFIETELSLIAKYTYLNNTNFKHGGTRIFGVDRIQISRKPAKSLTSMVFGFKRGDSKQAYEGRDTYIIQASPD